MGGSPKHGHREGMDTLLNLLFLAGLFMGGGGFLLAGGLSYALGPSSWRMVAVLAVGWVAIAVAVVLWSSLAASSSESCDDCGEILGLWVSKIILFIALPLNVVGWGAGTLLGWGLRRLAGQSPGPTLY
jgi:hypothetical protein